jgi:hypothetical protein
MSYKEKLRRRGLEYTQRRALTLGDELGTGVHGSVFLVESHGEKGTVQAQSAIKIYQGEGGYRQERDVYFRLKEHGVATIRGCHVPELLSHDDEFWVIEMTVVTRPFVLDFAGAYLDWGRSFPRRCSRTGWLKSRSSSAHAGWTCKRFCVILRLSGCS